MDAETNWGICRKFIFLFIFGFRMRAIAILGREVMLPRGLVGLGTDTVDHCGPEINEVGFDIRIDPTASG